MTTLTISLPDSLRQFIDQQVKTKGYGNTSEYVRTLVREAQEAEAAKKLESLVIEGIESDGEDLEADAQFWAELKAEAVGLLAKRKRR